MIELAPGVRLNSMLDWISARPGSVRQVYLCSPFMDEAHVARAVVAVQQLDTTGSGITIITTPDVADLVSSSLPSRFRMRRNLVIAVPGLHAKAYVMLGRIPYRSEGFVASSNMTAGGTRMNFEAGVYFDDTCPGGRRLLEQAMSFLSTLVRNAILRPRNAA